tara:strand:- start:53 stop:1345 length:1293 start_codon:yes stop_codon:yes gene_type:complete
MVKKPVAKKEKKKSPRQLQIELDKKRLEAFNSAVAEVRDIFAKVKYKKTKPPKIVYLKGGNDKKTRDLWRINGKQIKPSMKIMFRTNAQRTEVLEHLKEFSDRRFNTTWTTERKLSSLGHLMFDLKYMFPDKIRNDEIVEVQKIIVFHVVVKYDDDKAFKDLPYGNDLLNRTVGSLIKQRKPDTSLEQQILYEINTKLYDLGDKEAVDLTIQGDTGKYKKIVGFIPGSSGVHADFVGIDVYGEQQCFISHKDGQRAKDFQQYSGISSKAGDNIYNAKETKRFREIIANKESSDFDNQSFSLDIKGNPQLQIRSVLGPNWNGGGTDPGENNCTHFMQGYVEVIRQKKYNKGTLAQITIRFGNKNIHASDINSLIMDDDYAPTLGARKTNEDRSVTSDDNEVKNVRGGIFSSAYIKGRPNNIELPVNDSERQ